MYIIGKWISGYRFKQATMGWFKGFVCGKIPGLNRDVKTSKVSLGLSILEIRWS